MKPEEKKLQKAINKAMEDDEFYDTILEAAQGRQISKLKSALADAKEIRESIIASNKMICDANDKCLAAKDKRIEELDWECTQLRCCWNCANFNRWNNTLTMGVSEGDCPHSEEFVTSDMCCEEYKIKPRLKGLWIEW